MSGTGLEHYTTYTPCTFPLDFKLRWYLYRILRIEMVFTTPWLSAAAFEQGLAR